MEDGAPATRRRPLERIRKVHGGVEGAHAHEARTLRDDDAPPPLCCMLWNAPQQAGCAVVDGIRGSVGVQRRLQGKVQTKWLHRRHWLLRVGALAAGVAGRLLRSQHRLRQAGRRPAAVAEAAPRLCAAVQCKPRDDPRRGIRETRRDQRAHSPSVRRECQRAGRADVPRGGRGRGYKR